MVGKHIKNKPKVPEYRVFHAEKKGHRCDIIVVGANGTFYFATFGTDATEETIKNFTPEEIYPIDLYFFKASEVRRLFVRYNPDTMTRFTDQPSSSTFVKRQGLKKDIHHQYSDGIASLSSQLLRREIEMMEKLSKFPHPNIVEYRGVLTDPALGGRYVTDIVYKRYDCDLMELYLDKASRTPENARFILDGVTEGVRHLHLLGIAHHDLRPDNIFVKYEVQDSGVKKATEVVIGDFDAAMGFGSRDSFLKHAPAGIWWNKALFRDGDVVDGAPDLHSLRMLEEWLWYWLRRKNSSK
ncbi:hypothetical protein DM02DRAFT_672343 [Periconia macrospinosa]|uniref:Protein kinase domain-containing protein n=1 Tax=Periconia macrospinosa TaxID=97972 RepID=A0A2V1DRP6_9PLEO|nr:hypothetical protein DM02DRAFT_672343 [Periconia macrospinosa]